MLNDICPEFPVPPLAGFSLPKTAEPLMIINETITTATKIRGSSVSVIFPSPWFISLPLSKIKLTGFSPY